MIFECVLKENELSSDLNLNCHLNNNRYAFSVPAGDKRIVKTVIYLEVVAESHDVAEELLCVCLFRVLTVESDYFGRTLAHVGVCGFQFLVLIVGVLQEGVHFRTKSIVDAVKV